MHDVLSPPAPDPALRLRPGVLSDEYPRDFYRGDTATVARALIGATLARRHRGRWYGARIVETEAYLGIADRAAHSWGGRRTARVEPMYLDGGHIYVFLVYGMHYCANVVTGEPGVPEAVLLRAAEGFDNAPARLLSGPGRLCRALGITRKWSGADLLSGGDLRIYRAESPPARLATSRRIGVDYAGDARDWPLRFFDLESAAVSGPRR